MISTMRSHRCRVLGPAAQRYHQALADPEKVRTYLELISTGAQVSAGVVARLREFYRPKEHGETFVAVDLASVGGHSGCAE